MDQARQAAIEIILAKNAKRGRLRRKEYQGET